MHNFLTVQLLYDIYYLHMYASKGNAGVIDPAVSIIEYEIASPQWWLQIEYSK